MNLALSLNLIVTMHSVVTLVVTLIIAMVMMPKFLLISYRIFS